MLGSTMLERKIDPGIVKIAIESRIPRNKELCANFLIIKKENKI